MQHLKLIPGGELVLDIWAASKFTIPATTKAHQYLFEPVEVAEGVVLADIFKLLARNSVLMDIYEQDFSHSLLKEATQGPLPWDEDEVLVPDYLEVYQQCGVDTGAGRFQGPSRAMLHAMSAPVEQDWVEGVNTFAKAGSRCPINVALASPRQLLLLPLRVNDRADVEEVNIDARRFGDAVAVAVLKRITLGELLHAVLADLSWHGSPSAREAVKAELKAGSAALFCEGASEEELSSTNLMTLFGFAPFSETAERVFHLFGDVSYDEIESGLRQLEDRKQAGPALSELFGGKVSLKEEYASLTGMQLRRVVRNLGARTAR